jgi:hypothetical protein
MPQPAFALDRNGERLSVSTKVVSGNGIKTLQAWLTDGTDVLFVGDGSNRADPVVVLSLDAWKRLTERRSPGPRFAELDEPSSHSPLSVVR